MGTIPSQTIEQIAAANDIVEVIGSYFPLKRAGSTFKALCPFHQEKTPSFTVSPSRQTFHCFGCGAGGSVFRFVMDYEHLEFPAAVKKLAQRVGIPVIEERGISAGEEDRQHETRKALLQLHAEAAEWFHEGLVKGNNGAGAREYLKGRGIDRRIAKDWGIGFAPESWDAFLKWALGRGYQQRLLLESGLVARRDETAGEERVYDRFRNRIMFPIHNDVGEVIAFSGRILDKDAETAKYVNSPETPLFRKGRVLFGLHKTKRGLIEADCAIVCEGQLDLITLFEAGIGNVVAPQGTAFTEQQARILKRFVSEVVLCFDADAAGQKAAERSLEALLQNNLVVRVAEMPAGEDPDSLVRTRGRESFETQVAGARDFFDWWIEREASATDLDSLGAKMQLAQRLAETIGRVQDPLMRGEVSNRASARIGVPRADFDRLLAKPSRERFSFDGDEARAPERLPPPRHDVAMLCLLALRHDDARAFLLSQEWREMLSHTPDSAILARILEADLRPEDPASLNAFMATLSPGEEALVSSWLLRKAPPNGLEVAQGFWNGLRQAALRRQLQIAEGRMKLPRLTTGEAVTLQKQILDLTEQLRDLSAFSSARVLDT
ncbi:MAG TPA: DNA primase [Chthoniobacterales bacterium]|jgi:DNA primase|nr:DNA primase [Chthoniobacterales bacterium]